MPAEAAPADRPTKKQKRSRQAQDGPSASPHALLINLPFEILAEVLLYTCSPATVLAVSRTCSFLHRSLALETASFIWRSARRTCSPAPLPEPPTWWNKSEANYAAFVFGGGVCEVCGKATRAMYVSFAARIRLCGSWACRRKFLKSNKFLIDATGMVSRAPNSDNHPALWVPCVESHLCFFPTLYPESTWPNNAATLVRKGDWQKCQPDFAIYRSAFEKSSPAENNQAAASGSDRGKEQTVQHDKQRYMRARRTFLNIMEFSAKLILWRYDYDRKYKTIKSDNQAWAKSIAELEGWDLEDLLASKTFGSLQCRKNFLLELLDLDDLVLVRPAIETELLAMQVRHQRQKAEASYKARLVEVKKIYEQMRCGTLGGTPTPTGVHGPLVLPTLTTFRTLPFMRTLKGGPDPSTVLPDGSSSINNIRLTPLTTSLIAADIHAWHVPVQKHLLGLIGYPNGWQSASTRTLSPLKRVTAWFFCGRCGEGKVGRKYRRERCLDFKGVCSHVCISRDNSEAQHEGIQEANETDGSDGDDEETEEQHKGKCKKKASCAKTLDWKVDVFQKDEKAIRAVKTILDLANLSEESPSTVVILDKKGSVIRCLSCTGWIVMDFATAIGHAHRHESMQIQLLSQPHPSGIVGKDKGVGAPKTTPLHERLIFHRDHTEYLLGPALRAHKLFDKVNYGCRHCFRVVEGGTEAGTKSLMVEATGKGAQPMNFNALRSHIKAKHGVQIIYDEDFFCFDYALLRPAKDGLRKHLCSNCGTECPGIFETPTLFET